jgi:orotidine-5'-phosphate decarboxylase
MKPELIVALDVKTIEKAKDLVHNLCPAVKLFKIGNQLFTEYGPKVVQMVGERGGKVFLDLKYYDIPNTVQNACYSGTGTGSPSSNFFFFVYSHMMARLTGNPAIENVIQYPVFMMTVHAAADIEILQSAVKGAAERARELNIARPKIVGVTALTGENVGSDRLNSVLARARNAKKAGLDGIVCSVYEAAEVRKLCGDDFIIVTPGIRPKGAEAGDQKRVATPEEAFNAGADFIVVGRPILEADDPLKAAKEILAAIS